MAVGGLRQLKIVENIESEHSSPKNSGGQKKRTTHKRWAIRPQGDVREDLWKNDLLIGQMFFCPPLDHSCLLSVPERTSLASYSTRRNSPSGAAAPDLL